MTRLKALPKSGGGLGCRVREFGPSYGGWAMIPSKDHYETVDRLHTFYRGQLDAAAWRVVWYFAAGIIVGYAVCKALG